MNLYLESIRSAFIVCAYAELILTETVIIAPITFNANEPEISMAAIVMDLHERDTDRETVFLNAYLNVAEISLSFVHGQFSPLIFYSVC